MSDATSPASPYVKALEFARSLRAPGNRLDFPSYSAYVHLVAALVHIDLEASDPGVEDFQELPDAFELAYLTARLERLREHIRATTGVDVRSL